MAQILTHLKINKNNISKYVLLPGDPKRTDIIGKYLKNFKILNQNREFRLGKGSYKGIPVTVCSTGIGSPSTAIAVEEIISAGAEILIRVGTCGGSWKKYIKPGSLVIPTACVRDEGTTLEYIPLGFPAVADLSITCALRDAAIKRNCSYFAGINRTHDAFYGNQKAIKKWGDYLLEKNWKSFDTPILSSDMETSALFVIANLRGVSAGAILGVNANPEDLKSRLFGKKQRVVAEMSERQTEETVAKSIKVTLEALKILYERNKK